MNHNGTEFSIVTNAYLAQFHSILNEMIEQMTHAKQNNSISHNFMVQMIPHHMAAIEMSKNILKYTTFIPVQNIALNIIKEQTESIHNMSAILNHCSMFTNTDRELALYQQAFDQITRTMFYGMKNANTANSINTDFMNEMIPHHMGAIQLSQNALRFPICRELVPILQAIIVSQQNGVRQMKYLLANCASAADSQCNQ